MNKVSVIIPCYNVQFYIENCINSVINQTYKSIEIICVNDGSTDETWNILEKLKKEHSDLIIIISTTNQGAPAARNVGLKIAKGDYIQFLDADDILLPNKIEHQVSIIIDSLCDLVVANYYREKNQIRSPIYYSENKWIGLIQGKIGITSSNLWKTSVVKELEGWDNVKSSQEYHLMFKMLKNDAKVSYDCSFNTIIKVQNNNSISQKNPKDNWIRYIDLRMDIIEYIKEKKLLTRLISHNFNVIFFGSIQILYTLDKQAAINLYKKYTKMNSLFIEKYFKYLLAYKLYMAKLALRINLFQK